MTTEAHMQDSYRRSLFVIAGSDYPLDHGMPRLDGVPAEIADIRAAFAALGFPANQHRVLIDQSATDIQAELTDWLRARRRDDVAAIYVTGHAEALGDGPAARLYLHTPGSRQGRPAGTVRVGDLLDGLGEVDPAERPQNILLVLDVCAAETGIAEARDALARWLPARFTEAGVSTGIYLVATARRDDRARVGAFASAWRAAVEAPDVAARAVPYLDLAVLVACVQSQLARQVVVTASSGAKGPNVCLPNPRHHLTGVQWREMDSWWDATARAARSGGDETATLFTGRRRINARITRWLTGAPGERPVAIVTAAPGSGKSTLLARFVAVTVPDFRARFAATDDPATRPPDDFAFAAAIPAQGLTVTSIAERVRTALGIPEGRRLDELGADSRRPPRPPIVLVDSVDEAESPVRLVREVLRPLAVSARRGHVRLLVGTRRRPVGHDSGTDDGTDDGTDLIALLSSAAPHEIFDLDVEWLERGDIAEYAARILSTTTNALGRPNPYADEPRARRRLARAIEDQAKHAFFLAALVAQAHTLDDDLADPTSPTWVAEFPRSIGTAFEQELHRAYGPSRAARYRALLRPLAYGQGIGLPRVHMDGSDLWAGLAGELRSALDGSPHIRFTTADIDDVLQERIASHVVASTDDSGRTTFRFHHAALREHFLPERESQRGHQTVTAHLLTPLGDLTADAAPWAKITGYMRRALPRHAHLAGRLPELCTTAGFLIEADPIRIHDEFTRFVGSDGALPALKRIFRGLLHRLPDMDSGRRASVLAWECLGEPSLRRLVSGLEVHTGDGLRRWAAVGQIEPARMTIDLGETVPMALTPAPSAAPHHHDITDRMMGVAAGVETLLVDPASGEPLGTLVDPEEPGQVLALAFGWDAEGFAFLALGGRRLSIWEPPAGVLLSAGPDQGDLIRSIVTGAGTGDIPFVAAATGARVFAVDPGTGRELWQRDAEGAMLAVASTRSWGDVLAVASWEEVVLLDPVSGTVRATAPTTGVPLPAVCAVPRPDAGDLIVVSGEHSTVAWNPDGGELHIVPGLPARGPHLAACPAGSAEPFVCVAQLNGTVLVWDPISRSVMQQLSGHQGRVESLVSGTDQVGDPLLAIGSDAGVHSQLSVWNPTTGQLVLQAASETSISAVGIGQRADGTPYVATGCPRRVHLWDLPDLPAPALVEFGRAATGIAAVRNSTGDLSIMVTSSDVDVPVWTADRPQHVLRGAGPDAVLAAALNPQGEPVLLTMADDFVVRDWDPIDGRLSRMVELLDVDVDAVRGPGHLRLRAYPGGRTLAAAGAKNRVRVWDLESLECAWESSLPEPTASTDPSVTALALGQLTGGEPYIVFGTADGRVIRSLLDRTPGLLTKADLGGVTDVITGTSAAGRDFYAAGGRTGGPAVWDALTGERILDLDANDGWTSQLAIVPTEACELTVAATVSTIEGFVLRAWDPDTGTMILEDDLSDLTAGPVFIGSLISPSGDPHIVALGGEEMIVINQRRRILTPLPSRVQAAIALDEAVVIATRAGYLAASLDEDRAALVKTRLVELPAR